MKITRIDSQTVNCIITEEDLDEQGLRLEDLLSKNEQAVEFLKGVLERAAEEVGYQPEGNITAMQASVLSDGSVSLMISEHPVSGLREALDMVSNHLGIRIPDRILKEIGDAPAQEQLGRLQEFLMNLKDFSEIFRQMIDKHMQEGAKEQLPMIAGGIRREKESADAKGRLLFHEYVFAFDELKEAILYAKRIPYDAAVNSTLVKGDDGFYRLIFGIGTASERVFASIFTIGYEFGYFVTTKPKEVLHIKEHSETIIAQDALQKLRQISL